MEELFDIVDEKGEPTGEVISRSKAHELGIRHRTAHIWVVRKGNGGVDVLLQKRSLHKDSYPGCLDTSSAGHIHAGDAVPDSALRELEEELGIKANPETLHFAGQFRVSYEEIFYGKLFKDNEVGNVFVYTEPVDETKLVLQAEELEGVCWKPLEEVWRAVKEEDEAYCVPIGGLTVMTDWLIRKGWWNA